MKQVFNWTIGSFFRTIGRIVAYLIIGAIIAFILMYKPKAATLTSYDTYQLYWNGQSGCGSSNKYSYTTYANSNPAGDLWQQGTIGTRVYDKGAEIAFNFQYNLTANKYYDVDINLMSSDLSNSLNTTNVYIDSGTSCQDFSGSRVSLIGFSLNNSGTNYSNKATIRIMANSATTYWGIRLYKGPTLFVAGPNNFGISSITINEVDPSNTNVIIDNATNNTTNIINNNNENTQQIIDNQSQLLGKKCDNLYNPQNVFNGYINTGNTSIAYETSGDRFSAIVQVDPNTTYTISKKVGHSFRIATTAGYPNNNTQYITTQADHTASSMTITTGSTANYLVIFFYSTSNGDTGGFNNQDLMVVKGSTSKPYCEYGSYSSKLDETNDSINNLTDTLTDTNTDDDANDLTDYFNNLELGSQNTLANIVLLPVNFLSQLLDDSSLDDLCTTYKNKQICLPNGKLIWGRNNSLINTFKTFFQLVVGGYLSFKCLSSIFHTAENALQPDKTTAEVMKL